MIKTLQFVNELHEELESKILPNWTNRMTDVEYGGFYGRIDGSNKLHKKSAKGSVLNARILWTFSRAFNQFHKNEYREMASRARHYILRHFISRLPNGDTGVYWKLDYKGKPVDTRNQIYAIAFTIYGLAEYYELSRDDEVLDTAWRLYNSIEHYSFDPVLNGYFEAFDDKWKLLADLRLSEKDANEKKTMNTHLHILEAYTALYRVWPEDNLRKKLINLIHIFLNHIVDQESGHLRLFFDEHWNSKSKKISFGHDIEGSWLLCEAAEAIRDVELINKTREMAVKIVEVTLKEGLDEDNGLFNEIGENGAMDYDKHWWPQAEAMVGLVNIFKLTNNAYYLDKAIDIWNFIQKTMVDVKNGEWYFRVDRNGKPFTSEDKAGFWKCPYHNGRACMELIKRLEPGPSFEMMY